MYVYVIKACMLNVRTGVEKGGYGGGMNPLQGIMYNKSVFIWRQWIRKKREKHKLYEV